MDKKKLRPVVLAGGSGKRLWPLSTKQRPKQFISLFGDFSLFDLTLQRLNKGSLFKFWKWSESIRLKRFFEKI